MADTVKSVSNPLIHGMVVLNPDGTNGGASTTDGSTFTAGSSAGNIMEAVYESSPSTVADGKAGAVGMDAQRALKVTLASAISNLIDKITTYQATDAIMSGTTALVPKFVAVDAATSGDNTLIAAVTGKKIRVIGGQIVASGAVTVRFESGTGGTALTGQMQMAANGVLNLPYSPVGNFETASATLLNLELSGATSVDGWLMYVEV